ncbi:deoxyguanosinetriphosphate triphosphohydrolase [Aquibaculum arenosum]|uniref:Deoxyguanosinetriphosphate triphosphohydrolase-like protein n=1 Tax=Aquibaculum arenosum TaxID=3032591 RepID=A0ABT5YPF6_9PROT|nr:deoxyguanosinetriphosphate triphosphohydrolase [Fodinicurvata sp. CAU 1616]MDF2096717.1 deoxyguanosinetriphosphate triphosphohydrolase [Fodinicurvata sp. CAU 1616]
MSTSSLAPYACHAARSRGRLVDESPSLTRSAFQRDRDRIIHAGAFRKLQYKTQVFVYHEGDYYRTRLTHSLEVAQIARSVARALQLDEDLAEAIALAHDLGHTPFGHAGEDALKAAMEPHGGFDHNEQTFRVVTQLEERYPSFDGLNLTWESLEGLAKHNGPVSRPRPTIAEFDAQWFLELDGHASAEAQVAALADDIAYVNHDLDDGLRAGLFSVEECRTLPLVGEVFVRVEQTYPGVEQARQIHAAVRELIGVMVDDLLRESRKRLAEDKPASVDELRQAGRPLIAFSAEVQEKLRPVRKFQFARMYRHYRVNRLTSKARRVLRQLFDIYLAEPNLLPDEWRLEVESAQSQSTQARVVADYVAGMTDRYALESHEKLFNPYLRL